MITLCTVRTEKNKYVITTTDAKHKYKEYQEALSYAEQQRRYSAQIKMMADNAQLAAAQAQASSSYMGLYGQLDFHYNISGYPHYGLGDPRPGQLKLF